MAHGGAVNLLQKLVALQREDHPISISSFILTVLFSFQKNTYIDTLEIDCLPCNFFYLLSHLNLYTCVSRHKKWSMVQGRLLFQKKISQNNLALTDSQNTELLMKDISLEVFEMEI